MVVDRLLTEGPASLTPSGIIIHAMGEYVGGIYAPDFLESRGLSAHALVTPSGDIIRCRKDTQGAWHALGYNYTHLGIEFLVPGDHTYASFLNTIKKPWVSDEQLLAGARWVSEWMARYGIGQDAIMGHNVADALVDNKRTPKQDPGDGFPMGEFRSALYEPG